jgi:hypothetical protein
MRLSGAALFLEVVPLKVKVFTTLADAVTQRLKS